ncbi:MAG: metallophosphoesterase family protein [Elusimicrobiota bacterium]
MKIGIFSDIHGNIYAFNEVMNSLKNESCDLHVFLGDACGYYYYANEIIDVLRDMKNLVAVRGNHDDIFIKIIKNKEIEKEYTERYGKALSLLKNSISPKNMDYLKKLPEKERISKYSICMYHGSPSNHLEGYVYPTNNLSFFKNISEKYVFLGHTHYPMNKTTGAARFINPGSCGQPRDFDMPSYAVLNVETGEFKIKRVDYNKNALIEEILRHGENNKYLIKILNREIGHEKT